MNLTKHTLAAAGCLLVFAHLAAADVIVLKNGERIVGRDIREVGDKYLIGIKVSETIWDEKTVPRADVSYIEKEEADEKAFKELEGLVPVPELLGKEAYESRIERIEEFVKAHPKSIRIKKAKEMHDALSAEHGIISAGGIKIGDELVSAGAYEANAYEYDVRIAEKQIKDAAGRRDFLRALRKFAEYETRFGESEGRQGMVALMLQVLKAYKASLDEGLASLGSRTKKRLAGLARMAPEDRAKTKRALEDQMEKSKKRYAQEKAEKQKWITPDAFHKESMDEALRQVVAEITRLEKIPQAKPLEMPLAEAYRAAWGKLADGDNEAKMAALEKAKARGLTEHYLAKLRTRAGLDDN